MENIKYEITAPLLGEFDVAVCGGGIAGFASAADYAAFLCVKENVLPGEVDGRTIRQFMEDRGYEL